MPLGNFMKILKEGRDDNYLKLLNRYGDNKFCKFKIDSHLKDKGIYCFIEGNTVKYIGRCVNNFNKRINQGYGRISPKNCFIDGQATNCHINSRINSSSEIKLGIYTMTDKKVESIKQLEKKLLSLDKYDWNTQSN